MRLDALDHGHDLPTRLTLRAMGAVGRTELPEIVKVTNYRHRYFGTPYTDLLQDLMRGPSSWSVGERELFAAFTSTRNQCQFCLTAHQEVAASYLDRSLVERAIVDPASAHRSEVAAVLSFLAKIGDDPDAVTSADVEQVHAAGVTDEALEEAVRISIAFHVINRVMDAMGAGPLEGKSLAMGRSALRRFGYRNPPLIRVLSRAR